MRLIDEMLRLTESSIYSSIPNGFTTLPQQYLGLCTLTYARYMRNNTTRAYRCLEFFIWFLDWSFSNPLQGPDLTWILAPTIIIIIAKGQLGFLFTVGKLDCIINFMAKYLNSLLSQQGEGDSLGKVGIHGHFEIPNWRCDAPFESHKLPDKRSGILLGHIFWDGFRGHQG